MCVYYKYNSLTLNRLLLGIDLASKTPSGPATHDLNYLS